MTFTVPPIKSQGIKVKLSHWIAEHAQYSSYETWIEPFMGTCAVVFNVKPKSAILADTNPHLVNFYNKIKSGEINHLKVRSYLHDANLQLLKSDGEYYYSVRDRFNKTNDSLDFLFLSRSCFNGMMRFNRKGGFNVPFCKKVKRFSPALITKICNQVKNVSIIINANDYHFLCQDFEKTIAMAKKDDLVYCDPPYIGRHVDYFDSWDEKFEIKLKNALMKSQARFIMSTWLKNKYRENSYIKKIWSGCHISTKEHFYHVGGKEKNRGKIIEALLTNYDAVSLHTNLNYGNINNSDNKYIQGELNF